MKKKNDQLMRVETLINNDRLKMKEEFSKLLEKDLVSLLQEYFYLDGLINIDIVKEGKNLKVSIIFNSNGIKNFINVPN